MIPFEIAYASKFTNSLSFIDIRSLLGTITASNKPTVTAYRTSLEEINYF